MMLRRAAQLVVLALGVLAPARAVGQQGTQPPSPPPRSQVPRSPEWELGQNSPNPFSAATVVPFVLGDPPTCTDAGHQYDVTLRIYNVLAQLVAIPVLQTGEFASGQPIVHLQLRCGTYTAFWNGVYLSTGQPVPPGVYLYRAEVDGRAVARKMVVIR
jgi:hypothetical protein